MVDKKAAALASVIFLLVISAMVYAGVQLYLVGSLWADFVASALFVGAFYLFVDMASTLYVLKNNGSFKQTSKTN